MTAAEQAALASVVVSLQIGLTHSMRLALDAANRGAATDEQIADLLSLRPVGAFIHICRERQP